MPQRRSARDDEEPFLFRFFVVVGTHGLAGRELIDAEPGTLRAQSRSDSNAVSPETIRKLRPRRTNNRAEIDSPNGVGTHHTSPLWRCHLRDVPNQRNSSEPNLDPSDVIAGHSRT